MSARSEWFGCRGLSDAFRGCHRFASRVSTTDSSYTTNPRPVSRGKSSRARMPWSALGRRPTYSVCVRWDALSLHARSRKKPLTPPGASPRRGISRIHAALRPSPCVELLNATQLRGATLQLPQSCWSGCAGPVSVTDIRRDEQWKRAVNTSPHFRHLGQTTTADQHCV